MLNFTNRMVNFAKTQAPVSMATPPTLLCDIACKLGITKGYEDKEKLVGKVNRKLEQFHKQYSTT